jgi:hypothetical protein
VPDVSGALLAILAPNHLLDGLLLMRDSSSGAAGCDATSEYHAALVALRGAMALSVGGGLHWDDGWLKGNWMRKFFGKGSGGDDVL